MHKVLNGDEAGLVAYYRFDHASGNALSEYTSGDHNGTLKNMSDADWVRSEASVGDRSHVGTGLDSLSENSEVPVDMVWDAGGDPGAEAVFAAIQVEEEPDGVTGLLAHYPSTYWELWISHNDAFQVDVTFHYDAIGGIGDEAALKLYTRSGPGGS